MAVELRNGDRRPVPRTGGELRPAKESGLRKASGKRPRRITTPQFELMISGDVGSRERPDVENAYYMKSSGNYEEAAGTFRDAALYYAEDSLPESGLTIESRLAACKTYAAKFAKMASDCYEKSGNEEEAMKMRLFASTLNNTADLQQPLVQLLSEDSNMELVQFEIKRIVEILGDAIKQMGGEINEASLLYVIKLRAQYEAIAQTGLLPSSDMQSPDSI